MTKKGEFSNATELVRIRKSNTKGEFSNATELVRFRKSTHSQKVIHEVLGGLEPPSQESEPCMLTTYTTEPLCLDATLG